MYWLMKINARTFPFKVNFIGSLFPAGSGGNVAQQSKNSLIFASLVSIVFTFLMRRGVQGTSHGGIYGGWHEELAGEMCWEARGGRGGRIAHGWSQRPRAVPSTSPPCLEKKSGGAPERLGRPTALISLRFDSSLKGTTHWHVWFFGLSFSFAVHLLLYCGKGREKKNPLWNVG